MNLFKKTAAATCALGLTLTAMSATTAQALTAVDYGVEQGDLFVSARGDENQIFMNFDWISAPVSGWVDFTLEGTGSIVFDAFDVYSGALSDVTGYTLDYTAGGVTTRLTNDTAFCADAGVAAAVRGSCNLFSQDGAVGGFTGLASTPGAVLFNDLVAGDYRFGIYDSSSPNNAIAGFIVYDNLPTVPLPAGGLLLLSGLGLIGAARRRKG